MVVSIHDKSGSPRHGRDQRCRSLNAQKAAYKVTYILMSSISLLGAEPRYHPSFYAPKHVFGQVSTHAFLETSMLILIVFECK